MPNPRIIDLRQIRPVNCPCGTARRAFADFDAFPGTVHLTEITRDAQAHFHRKHTEVYVILECDPDAAIELDGIAHPVSPMTAIAIAPGTVHRGIGAMKVLIVSTPNFDEADEFLVPELEA